MYNNLISGGCGGNMDIKFHCHEASNFKEPYQLVRAFGFADYSIEPHDHDFYEMNIVLGGTGYHKIGGTPFKVMRGDVFVIPPMTVHSYYDTQNLEVYHILFKKDFIRKNTEAKRMPGFLQLMEIEPFLRQTYSEAMFLHLTPVQLSDIEREFKFIEQKGTFDTENYLPLCTHTAWKIIYYLSHLLHEQIEGAQKGTKSKYERQILDTLEYIHYHYSEKLTIEGLAERIYVSRSTFLRNFETVCGCSPIQYLHQYRIKKAEELLESSELSKTEIAHLCGFYDLSHMERAVKKTKKG